MKNYKLLSSGFSLIEVLVALIILAIGMLGIAAMLLLSHKTNGANYLRQQAIQSAANIIDIMHANRPEVLNGSYNINNLVSSGAPSVPSAPASNCSTTACTPSQIATYNFK